MTSLDAVKCRDRPQIYRTSCVNQTRDDSPLNKSRKLGYSGQRMTIVSVGQDASYICVHTEDALLDTITSSLALLDPVWHSVRGQGFFSWLLTFKPSQIKNRGCVRGNYTIWFLRLGFLGNFFRSLLFCLLSYSFIRGNASLSHTRYKSPTNMKNTYKERYWLDLWIIIDEKQNKSNEATFSSSCVHWTLLVLGLVFRIRGAFPSYIHLLGIERTQKMIFRIDTIK